MATIEGGKVKNWYAALDYTISQSIESNTSTIHFTFRIYKYNNYRTYNANASECWWRMPGKSSPGGWTVDLPSSGWYTIGTADVTVQHNGDGTGSYSASAVYHTGITSSSVAPTELTVSATITLPTIPRASGLSCPTITLGQPVTLRVDRKVASFTHTVLYDLNGTKGTICQKETEISIQWTPGEELASSIPNAASAALKLAITTYSGNTVIGSKEITVTALVPSHMVPTGTLTATGNREKGAWDGVVVKGYGTVSYQVEAQGVAGSTIESCVFTFGGERVEGLRGKTAVLQQAGTFTPQAIITDSRGRTAAIPAGDITVEDYSYPTISAYYAKRTDDVGKEKRDGTYVTMELQADVGASVGGRNRVALRYRYRQAKGTWSGYTPLDGKTTVGGFLKNLTYELELSAVDTMGNARAVAVVIGTAEVTWHAKAGGKAFAFGKYAEEDGLLDVSWHQRIRGNLRVDGGLTIGGKALLDMVYPVGSIYMSVNNVSPATFFGGTWVTVEGRFLLAAGEKYPAGSTGGNADATLPKHSHGFKVEAGSSTIHGGSQTALMAAGTAYPDYLAFAKGAGWTSQGYVTIDDAGEDPAGKNLPPYLAVYMWKRTA